MKKARIMFITLFAVLLIVVLSFCAPKVKYYSLSYFSEPGGRIEGEAAQIVAEGASGAQVTAIPNDGYKFEKWSDGVETPQRQDKEVNLDIQVTAIFSKVILNTEPNKYELTYIASEGGRIEGNAKQSVIDGANGTVVTAVPNEGYKFVKWSDGLTITKRQEQHVTKNITVTAKFALIEKHTLTYIANEGGRVVGMAVQTVLNEGDGVPVKAIADFGYTFVGWSDGATSYIRIDKEVIEDKTVTAYFEPLPIHTITYTTSSDYGYIQGKTNQEVLEGGSGTTVTAIANEHCEFTGWSDRVKSASRQEKNVTADKQITAHFALVYFRHVYSANPEYGRIEGDAEQWVYKDEMGTEVTAVPNEGYLFSRWSDGVTTPTRQDSRYGTLNLKAYFVKGIEVNYRVNNGIGGRIEGSAKQYLFENSDTEEVKAVADEGYVFAGWSDCLATAERSDKCVTENFNATAYFEPVEKVFRYDYKGSTAKMDAQTVTVKRDNPKASVFAVPQKDGYNFVGWYADENYAVRVTDEYGGLMYGYNTVTLDTDTLYARWSDPNDDTIVWKVLLVMVDDIDATLRLREDNTQTKRVQRKMPMPERILCKQIALRMSAYLNEWFDGKVKFEIDTYFTTQTINEDGFMFGDEILAFKIDEVKHLLTKYNSLLTFLDMNDMNSEIKLLGTAGIAYRKYGCVYLERFMEFNFRDSIIADKVMQGTFEGHWSTVETALHELTHTIECYYSYGDITAFHIWMTYYLKNYGSGIEYEMIRRYLLCEAEMDGEIVGIPPNFWEEKSKDFTE